MHVGSPEMSFHSLVTALPISSTSWTISKYEAIFKHFKPFKNVGHLLKLSFSSPSDRRPLSASALPTPMFVPFQLIPLNFWKDEGFRTGEGFGTVGGGGDSTTERVWCLPVFRTTHLPAQGWLPYV